MRIADLPLDRWGPFRPFVQKEREIGCLLKDFAPGVENPDIVGLQTQIV